MSVKKVTYEIDGNTAPIDGKLNSVKSRMEKMFSDATSLGEKVYWLYYHTHFISQAILRNLKGTVIAQGVAIAQGMIWDAKTIQRLQIEANAAFKIAALTGSPWMWIIGTALEASVASIVAMNGQSIYMKLQNEQLQQQIELNQNTAMYTNG